MLRCLGGRHGFGFGSRHGFRNRRGTFGGLRLRRVMLQLKLIKAESHTSEGGLHIGYLGMHLFPWCRINHLFPETLEILDERVQTLSKVC